MFFFYFAAAFSFNIKKSLQKINEDMKTSVVIEGSTFNSNQYTNIDKNLAIDDKKLNKKSISANFGPSLSLSKVNSIYSNITLVLEAPMVEPDIRFENTEVFITNLTIQNAQSTGCSLFYFDSSNVEIQDLKFSGTSPNATLFQGTVRGFQLKNSHINKFTKSTNDQISIINLDLLSTTDKTVMLEFLNNNFEKNNFPIFGISKELQYNVSISQNTFTENTATNGSCVYISKYASKKNNFKIIIDNNTFSHN